jgi:integrase
VLKTINRIRATEYAKLLKTEGKHNDGGSLYLVVRGGSARWEYQYREGGTLYSQWLGSAVGYAPMSLAQAREARVKAWLENRGNGQPHNRPARVAGKTFAEGLREWLDANPSAWAEKSGKARRGLIEGKHALTSLLSLDVAKITQADVLTALANEKSGRMHAEKRGWLKAFFAHAKAQQWRMGDNPAKFDDDTRSGFTKVKTGKHHATIAWADFAAVFKGLPDSNSGNAVRFAALTAARAGEVENATWSQIVSDNGHGKVWQYTILKGDTPFEQRVPLTKAALDLIGERGADDALIFGKLPANAMLYAIKDASKNKKATVHGLRSTFNEWCDDQDDPPVDTGLIDAALAHYRGDKVQRTYSRGDLLNRRRTVMESWATVATGR